MLTDQEDRARYDRGEIDAMGTEIRRGASRGFRAKASGRTSKSPFERFRQRKKAETIKIDGTNVDYSLKVTFEDAVSGTVKYIAMANGKRLKVSIPAGTKDGQVLRLRGQGMPGMGGGRDGDALVTIEVPPNPLFKIEGTDVHLDLPVCLHEAILGARVEVPTIDGSVTMSIPENSNTGTILRLKGKGLPIPDAKDDQAGNGDQFITLRVVLPAKPDERLRSFIEHWRPPRDYDPRWPLLNDKPKADTKS